LHPDEPRPAYTLATVVNATQTLPLIKKRLKTYRIKNRSKEIFFDRLAIAPALAERQGDNKKTSTKKIKG